MTDLRPHRRAVAIRPGAPRWMLTPLALAVATLYSGQASANTAAVLRGASAPATRAAQAQASPRASNAASIEASNAAARSLRNRANVAASTDLARQAQAAARAAAQALGGTVPNGLGEGGLKPVENPLSFEDDTTGLQIWDGAAAPTQVVGNDGNVTVTVDQNESRAILSWESFNLGRETTLVFDQKDEAGNAQKDWVALNRVVGELDPATGRRDPSKTPAPSQILGSIKADGTVLVLNQNGVIFGATSQVNVRSLVATSLEVGRARVGGSSGQTAMTLQQRNEQFRNFGLLGYADTLPAGSVQGGETFSAQASLAGDSGYEDNPEGSIVVEAGADIRSSGEGYLLLAAPTVENAGQLSAPDGEIALQSGRNLTLTRSDGSKDSADPNVRGFLVSTQTVGTAVPGYVRNAQHGIIQADRGHVYLGAGNEGAVINQGLLLSTTSVSRNGSVRITAPDIQLAPGSLIAVRPDESAATIPQDEQSTSDFKPSRIEIGNTASRIEIGSNAMIYAPGGDIVVGAAPGEQFVPIAGSGASRIFIDSGAILDASGLKDVLVPASRNEIRIRPVTRNELRDAPDYKDGFLNGVTVYVDPRLSGVREDGVAWIGSPLIEAGSYYAQVGVGAAELMTTGGNVSLGVAGYSGGGAAMAPGVIVKQGAEIDISGGWLRYQAGPVRSSRLITGDGRVIDVGRADPNDNYVALYSGFTRVQARWGIVQSWLDPLLSGSRQQAEYTEGRDAGSLTIKGPTLVLDGTVHADAYAGLRQVLDGEIGSASSTVFGDQRALQVAASQLPTGGFLYIQALGVSSVDGSPVGGADIRVQDEDDYQSLDPSLTYGQSIRLDFDGRLIVPTRDEASLPPLEQVSTIRLSDAALSGAGFAQVSLHTSGNVTVDADADIELEAGGRFDVLAGRGIRIDGDVSVPSGNIRMETANFGVGSVFASSEVPQPGDFDVLVYGTLSARGRWVNDFNATPESIEGGNWLDGGDITLISAPRVNTVFSASVNDARAPKESIDLSGSILIAEDALLDLTAGGRVTTDGELDLSGRGGDLSLVNQTTYFWLADNTTSIVEGGFSGIRIGGNRNTVAVNPSQINARISFSSDSIRAAGFSGGGTFTLNTPQIAFGEDDAATGTLLPMDFLSESGFGRYDITSYRTDLQANNFNNTLGGYNALLATQTLTVNAGETLRLSQSLLTNYPDAVQFDALRALETGGDVLGVVQAGIPEAAWDRRGVELNLGGLLELHVAAGGRVEGEAGSSLGVGGLLNEGYIRLPGGTIRQAQILLPLYADGAQGSSAVGVRSLSEVFSTLPDGSINPNARSLMFPQLTNSQVAARYPIYLLGELDAGEGVRLANGSITDLSGITVLDPRATAVDGVTPIRSGRIYDGGTLELLAGLQTQTPVFTDGPGRNNAYDNFDINGVRTASTITAEAGSLLDLSGTADTQDRVDASGNVTPTLIWSNGGRLTAANGGTFTGATIDAHGGAPLALGGTLTLLDPTLYQEDPATALQNALSVAQIDAAGFGALVALGSIGSVGDVSLELDRGFFLYTRPYAGRVNDLPLTSAEARDAYAPTVHTDGGTLQIAAPYIRFDSNFQDIANPATGTAADGTAIFRADAIDIEGAVLFDRSIADVRLEAEGDLRLIGVSPYQQTYGIDNTIANSLAGELVVNGDLSLIAGQVYPTTGSRYLIDTVAPEGLITFGRSSSVTPATPYSAGGSLTVQAADIVQGGVVRVPLGQLNLQATGSVQLIAGSVTSVSANGLSIPYGTTTDQTEYFFSPTGNEELSAPPTGELRIDAADVVLAAGATVDLSGGGDVYAYEFVPGTGGSRDVLDRNNPDAFSGNDGLQYPDGRQVYAIVPGLSDATAAAYDPIYSSGYDDLGSVDGAGRRVYLDGVPGLAAGWYTLLPARYALLPGGMRIVERSGSEGASASSRSVQLRDGTTVVAGRYGTAGTDAQDADLRLFEVQSQDSFRRYSNIVLTSASEIFSEAAEHDGTPVPRLPNDAARLVLNPSSTLRVDTVLLTQPGKDGRGAQADIGGENIEILSQLPLDAAADGVIRLTAGSLSNLNASSLLIGGVRSDNDDGTTTLDISASHIRVANDADAPLSAPEVILAVDGEGSGIVVEDGASIVASGELGDSRSGDYIIDGSRPGQTASGAVLRVANGPERLVDRIKPDAVATASTLAVGAATLRGESLLLESSGDVEVSSAVALDVDQLAVGAGQISFADDAEGLAGLVITDELQALFGAAERLTLRTPGSIAFDDGDYSFGNLRLDAQGITARQGGDVSLTAADLELSNDHAAAAACADSCGTGALSLSAQELTLGPGTFRVDGFSGGVEVSASEGIYSRGESRFDSGAAALTLHTPYIGDRAAAQGTAATGTVIPSLTIVSGGALLIDNAGAAATLPAIAGVPGAVLNISGQSVDISGTRIRATAGIVDIDSATGIVLREGATVEAPGYSRNFGDADDPVVRSSPGGRVTLEARGGDIELGTGTLVSVGGGAGSAGTLELLASAGSIAFNGTLDAKAPDGGGALRLDTGGAFDLTGFGATAAQQGFTRALDIRSRSGNLDLAAGQTLQAQAVQLTADGGSVRIDGTIDVSGINGGDVSLNGADGVTLSGTALIDAHADGYAASDSRQAEAGTVNLSVGEGGGIEVQSGARIDVSARRGEDRLVPIARDGQTYYYYVRGDEGGVVHLRAPLIEQDGADTVDVSFAGSIEGARDITLEGYRRFDLGDASYGIGIETGADGVRTAVLNPATQGFLSAADFDGGLVRYVQDFDISGAYDQLGGLAGSEVFHARAGVDLAFDGNIRLDAAWNLGAGTVDVTAALADGSMALGADGRAYVVAGREGEVFNRHTQMLYRSNGGSVAGDAGVLNLRAAGTLDIAASISDGFFNFGDQTDAQYLAGATSARPPAGLMIPYVADSNAASPTLTGDPFGAARLMPLLADGSAADSWSYRLVGGADLASADLLRTSADADVRIRGERSYRYGTGASAVTAYARTLVRTGVGNIDVAAGGDIDFTNGDVIYRSASGLASTVQFGFQVGGSALYTAGHVADLSPVTVADPVSGELLTLNPAAFLQPTQPSTVSYRYGVGSVGLAGILISELAYAEGGGDVSLRAGGDVISRRDAWLESRISRSTTSNFLPRFSWIGTGDQPWRAGSISDDPSIGVNYQLFQEGVGALGGGDISIEAGRDVVDLSTVATGALLTGELSVDGTALTQALQMMGSGDVTLLTGRDLRGGRIDIASGSSEIMVGGDVRSAGTLNTTRGIGLTTINAAANELRLRLSDATLDLQASGDITIQGISSLGTASAVAANTRQALLDSRAFYSPQSAVGLVANGAVTVANAGLDVVLPASNATGNVVVAVYPGSFTATSLGSDLAVGVARLESAGRTTILTPSTQGQLELLAAGDIASATIAMEDGDPSLLPGVFSSFAIDNGGGSVLEGRSFIFPYVLPDSSDIQRRLLHNQDLTHAGDMQPVRIAAGGDIVDMILSVPKQARISAGQDILNMMFFGQNLATSDITRIVAGRDITATTTLLPGRNGPDGSDNTEARPALQGNTFVIGGPGSFFLEAGRDLGPFLNSAVVNAYVPTERQLTYGGGVLSVGNEWNPWLEERGASLYVMFGVAPGVAYSAFRDYYLDPAHLDALDDDLFEQVEIDDGGAGGVSGTVADRSKPIYAPILLKWLQQNAAAELLAAYGRTDVSYEQAYAVFKVLPSLRQRVFLIDSIYFNELAQTSIPDGPSFQQYSRGYRAVNTLFPAGLGYTENDLAGGSNGANELVQTGDLDLRLATIQTSRGGDIRILGPGGRVLAGSLVRTEQQAARRSYDGGRLFAAGVGNGVSQPAAEILSIPSGLEGILTLRGGSIFTFTDSDFLLNQSRLFTQAGGDIAMWSSNGDLNAGQGPKTSANFPPVTVRIDQDLYFTVDTQDGVTGAGIAAFKPAPGEPDPNVYLIAPRGTVDAGDAGVRVAGNLFVAAAQVANAAGFDVGGQSFGIAASGGVSVAAQTSASAASSAAEQAAEAAAGGRERKPAQSVITVEVQGYSGEDCEEADDRKCSGL